MLAFCRVFFFRITFMSVVSGMEMLLDGSGPVIVNALLDSDDDDDDFHEIEPAVESVPSLTLR